MLLIFAVILLICHTVHGVSIQCTSNCQNCTQQNTCDLCKPGYYKRKNECAKCHISCTRCSSLSECLTCAESYVLLDRWCYKCSEICDDCSEPGVCKVCKSQFYVTSNKGCNRCRENCRMCSNGTTCDSCRNGYYLQTSKCIECPERCLERQCSTDNGECNRGCVGGFYSRFCNVSCPKGCKDEICLQDGGMCTNGCNNGYYGTTCQRCPELCINKICSALDGRCIQGCVSGYYKDNNTGKCNKCPDNCKHCVHWFSCTSCIEGFFGQNCSSPCRYCMSGGCALDGICINGCGDGFYQVQTTCLHCPDNCSKCNSTISCTECKSGYLGNRCERKCPLNCIACNEQTVACINCTHHTFGELCEFSCSANCLMTSIAVSSCFQENGTCQHGCIGGFTGHNCTEETSTPMDTSTRVPEIIGSVLGAVLFVAATVASIFLIRWMYKRRAQHSGSANTERRYDDILGISIRDQTHIATVSEGRRNNESPGSADTAGLYGNILGRTTDDVAHTASLYVVGGEYETLGNPDYDDSVHIYDTTV